MPKTIESALEVFQDASSQILDLERHVNTFFQSNPYQRVIEHNTKTGADTHKVKLVREIPGQFRSQVRHIASDLRSSLDHIGYAAAIGSGKINPRKTYFPFAKSESERSNVRSRNCQDFPTEIFDLFWNFKPYLGGDETLWALNEIANCNKHRAVVPVGHGLAGGQMMTSFSCDGMCYEMAFPPAWCTSKNEAILCVVESGANTNYSIQLGFDICFGEVQILNKNPVLPVLTYLRDKVKAIISASAIEGARIGVFS
jgi:hypothetical protein